MLLVVMSLALSAFSRAHHAECSEATILLNSVCILRQSLLHLILATRLSRHHRLKRSGMGRALRIWKQGRNLVAQAAAVHLRLSLRILYDELKLRRQALVLKHI